MSKILHVRIRSRATGTPSLWLWSWTTEKNVDTSANKILHHYTSCPLSVSTSPWTYPGKEAGSSFPHSMLLCFKGHCFIGQNFRIIEPERSNWRSKIAWPNLGVIL